MKEIHIKNGKSTYFLLLNYEEFYFENKKNYNTIENLEEIL